jgi:hypothetical protein
LVVVAITVASQVISTWDREARDGHNWRWVHRPPSSLGSRHKSLAHLEENVAAGALAGALIDDEVAALTALAPEPWGTTPTQQP